MLRLVLQNGWLIHSIANQGFANCLNLSVFCRDLLPVGSRKVIMIQHLIKLSSPSLILGSLEWSEPICALSDLKNGACSIPGFESLNSSGESFTRGFPFLISVEDVTLIVLVV